jgi:itaconate CoA-transferase
MQGVWNHPQLKARNRWVQVGSPNGELPALLPPAVNSAFTPCMKPIPGLGEHSQKILAELGYSSERIEELARRGAI